MGAEHSSALTFNLEESVWLDKGQKMKELLSLGLEPDIRIEEKLDYVAIKGGLHLKGAYRPLDENRQEEHTDDRPSPQYVEQNNEKEDGVAEITHFFPVDVTIPFNRIHNLDDIYVQIDGFDYDLPEPDCIQLTADISITGMKSDASHTEESKEPLREPEPMPRWEQEGKQQPDEPEVPELSLSDNRVDSAEEETSVSNEADESADSKSAQVSPPASEREEERVENNEPDEMAEIRGEESEEAETQDTPEEREESEEEFDDSKEQGAEKSLSSNEETESDAEEETEEADSTIITAFHSRDESEEEKLEADTIVDDTASDEQTSDAALSTETASAPAASDRDDNALYLTKVMTKGEEAFSRVKMCIIQENESLETIAERYDVTISHLVRYNRLDNEHIEEGQILYIPASKAGSNKHEG
ncbi:stage VI sporulation protein D [Alteribacillus persepolensis]|uniref:Stage VI sporulation protein D n=1 Tax=Alteribacillus persepolensis TaxID=568899 RepID=A0A1G8JXE3_9BACI|nr:stage VI sporulation protein D [Alteribacillus persepolensis]SDI35828.1 stage VI sporulation protein D [Alteribacillus persepolensis]